MSEWISVKDRSPENLKCVLVWYEYFRYGDYNDMFQTYGLGYQCNGLWHVEGGGAKIRVFAWMPLPKPPKGELE